MATTTVQALKNADGNKIYPKTIADAVAYDSTRTVKGMLSNSVFCEHVKTVEDSDFPINATTLNGHTSDYFATVEDLADIASGASVVDLGDGETLKDYVGDQISIHNAAKNVHSELFKDATVYVNASLGSDNNSGLTQTSPFKTIQHAIDSLPVSAINVIVKIAAGTYAESVEIISKGWNSLTIEPVTDDADVTVKGIYIDRVDYAAIKHIKFNDYGKDNAALKCLYTNTFVNKCTFNNTIVDNDIESRAIVISGGTTTIDDNIINGYTHGIVNVFSVVSSIRNVMTNVEIAYYCNAGYLAYGYEDNVSYTNKKSFVVDGGLVISFDMANKINANKIVFVEDNAVSHNTIYRGKDITNYLNDGTLFTRISNGTFDDLFIGDYFTMNITVEGYTVQCNKYVLAGFDTYLNSGCDGNILTKHHAVIVPYSMMFTEAMDTKDTNSGYYNTNMHQVVLPKIATQLKTILDDHLLTYSNLLVNECLNDTVPSNWNWYDTNIRLLSEVDIKGASVFGSGRDVGMDSQQLPLFKLNSNFYIRKGSVWLSTSANIRKNAYCIYGLSGEVNIWDQTRTDCGVFPKFLIG